MDRPEQGQALSARAPIFIDTAARPLKNRIKKGALNEYPLKMVPKAGLEPARA